MLSKHSENKYASRTTHQISVTPLTSRASLTYTHTACSIQRAQNQQPVVFLSFPQQPCVVCIAYYSLIGKLI